MRNFRIFTALLLFFPLFLMQAQEKTATVDKTEKLKKPAQKRKEMLRLTPEQDAKYTEILNRYAQKRRDLKNDSIRNLEEKHKIVQVYFKDMDAEVKKVLNADQFVIYQEMESKKRLRMEQMQNKQPNIK